MFTGIIEEIGIVKNIVKRENLFTVTLSAHKVIPLTKIGDSIAVNGICLTVVKKVAQSFTFEVMKETIECTNLKDLRIGSKVNLERALKVGDRLGGHFVSGHIDSIGVIKRIIKKKNYVEFQVSLKQNLMRFLAPKGSVCIDGVSLTIGKVKNTIFSVYLIPHTLKVTTLGTNKVNDLVNIETDILAKYVLGVKNG